MIKRKNYEPQKKWGKLFSKRNNISYPAEGVIRIFKGSFPKLKLNFKKNNKILDLGFGDGRHLMFFKKLGSTSLLEEKLDDEIFMVDELCSSEESEHSSTIIQKILEDE